MDLDRQSSELMQQNLLDFDYTTLDENTRINVQQHTHEIKSLIRRTAKNTMEIGQKLIEVKEELGHGRFTNWLRIEFNWSDSAARKFMQVTRQFKSVNFTDLNISSSALYLLAAPSIPEAARQEAIERANQGETITHTKAKAISKQYQTEPLPDVERLVTYDLSAQDVENIPEDSDLFKPPVQNSLPDKTLAQPLDKFHELPSHREKIDRTNEPSGLFPSCDLPTSDRMNTISPQTSSGNTGEIPTTTATGVEHLNHELVFTTVNALAQHTNPEILAPLSNTELKSLIAKSQLIAKQAKFLLNQRLHSTQI